MSLESTIEKLVAAIAENTAAIREANSTMTAASVSTTAEPPKPKSVSAEPAPQSPKVEKKQAAKEEAPAVDKKTLTAKVIELAKTKGRETAAGALAEFGATKVPEVKEEDYGALFAKAEALLQS